jgi:hypothetical protein
MNITAASSFLTPLAGVASLQTPAVTNASDPDGDGDGGGRRVHGSHRGGAGPMQQALTQALQSLGLSMLQGATGPASNQQGSAPTDSDTGSDGSKSAASSVKQDLRHFMHALFQAIKGETTAGSGSTASDPSAAKTSFADGLSALISQVGNGSTPSDLQTAFSKLASDLQPSVQQAADGATTPGTANATAPQATLQALLTALQQDLGYGGSTSPAVGNSVSTQA